MRHRLGRRSGVLVALLLTFIVAGPVSPAAADATIVRPAAGATLDTSAVTVTGRAEAQTAFDLPLGTLESVTIRIGEQTVSPPGCTGVRSCEFSGTFTLLRNGSYSVAVETRTTGFANAGPSPSRTFSVAAPAARPVLDPPKVTDTRTVELSWSRNTEPDMLHYEVTRTDPGGSRLPPATVQQLDKVAKMTLTDPTTAASEGGTYTYEVRAVRRGATANSEVASEPSRVVSATVPVRTTSSTTAPSPPGSPAAGPTTTVKAPGPPAGVDLSGFLSSRSQPIPLPTMTVPEPPDTGFTGSLPFGVGPAGEELEEGEAEAVLPADQRRSGSVVSIDGGRPLVPVAGGLVLLLLALHMRLLGRRVKAVPDGDLPVELAQERPRATPPPEPKPEVHTLVYDIDADIDEDDGWAEKAVEPLAVEPDDEDEFDDDSTETAVEPVALDLEEAYDEGPDLVTVHPEPVAVEPVSFEPHAVEPHAVEPVALDLEDEYDDEDPAWVTVDPDPVAVEPDEYDDEEWAAAAATSEPVVVEPEPESEPEPVALWGPPEVTDEESPAADPDPEEIKVVEVVSSTRRRLVRSGSR